MVIHNGLWYINHTVPWYISTHYTMVLPQTVGETGVNFTFYSLLVLQFFHIFDIKTVLTLILPLKRLH